MAEKALKVAELHLLESRLDSAATRDVARKTIAARHAGEFDVVTCMELLEHVPEPASMVAACARLVRPGGQVFFSTINRNPKSYLFAVVGAEYVLKPAAQGHARLRALHQALGALALVPRSAGLRAEELIGMTYNPLTRRYRLGRDCDVNYLLRCVRDALSQARSVRFRRHARRHRARPRRAP